MKPKHIHKVREDGGHLPSRDEWGPICRRPHQRGEEMLKERIHASDADKIVRDYIIPH
jgi:hypothetical protein